MLKRCADRPYNSTLQLDLTTSHYNFTLLLSLAAYFGIWPAGVAGAGAGAAGVVTVAAGAAGVVTVAAGAAGVAGAAGATAGAVVGMAAGAAFCAAARSMTPPLTPLVPLEA